ncbi:MAG: MFS transporter [Paracoccaceae bacterium]
MKNFLSVIYFSRAVIVGLFLLSSQNTLSVLVFSAALGFTYLSTIPPTAALVGKMFGPRFMATLFGIALLSHQIGAFLGAYFGGYFFVETGSYQLVWFINIALALFSSLVHLPIKERRVEFQAV